MTAARSVFTILGFVCAMVPARASLTFQTTSTTFTTDADNDGLTVSSANDFGSVSGATYTDMTTGVEFLAFSGNGSTAETFLTTSGELETANGSADSIEVMFPTGVYGFAINFTTPSNSGLNLCVDPNTTFSNCDSGGTFVTQNGSAFIGTINDNPTPAQQVTTLWLHNEGGSNAGIDITSYEIATEESMGGGEAPECTTLTSLGTGLIGLAALRRRKRS
jgi:hypothetical protein